MVIHRNLNSWNIPAQPMINNYIVRRSRIEDRGNFLMLITRAGTYFTSADVDADVEFFTSADM